MSDEDQKASDAGDPEDAVGELEAAVAAAAAKLAAAAGLNLWSPADGGDVAARREARGWRVLACRGRQAATLLEVVSAWRHFPASALLRAGSCPVSADEDLLAAAAAAGDSRAALEWLFAGPTRVLGWVDRSPAEQALLRWQDERGAAWPGARLLLRAAVDGRGWTLSAAPRQEDEVEEHLTCVDLVSARDLPSGLVEVRAAERTSPPETCAAAEAPRAVRGALSSEATQEVLERASAADAHLVYVAGPYRAEKDVLVARNVQRARELGDAVNRAGAFAVVPHQLGLGLADSADEPRWLAGTLEVMRGCRAVALVEGWEKSSGSRGEVREAGRLGLPVFEPGPGQVQRVFEWVRRRRREGVAAWRAAAESRLRGGAEGP